MQFFWIAKRTIHRSFFNHGRIRSIAITHIDSYDLLPILKRDLIEFDSGIESDNAVADIFRDVTAHPFGQSLFGKPE